MKLAEEKKIILLASDMDYDDADPQTLKGINMKGYHSCTFLIDIGTMLTADATVKAYSGATDGDLSTALAFKYAYGASTCVQGSIASGADVLAAETTVTAATGLVIAYATYANYMLQIEVDASMMDVADGEEWLTLSYTTGTATGPSSIWAVLDPRYTKNRSATALA